MPNVCTLPANSPLLLQQSLKQLLQPAGLYKYCKSGFGMWLFHQNNTGASAAQVAAQGAAYRDAITDILNTNEWQSAFQNSNFGAADLLALTGGEHQGLWDGLNSSETTFAPTSVLLWDSVTKSGGYQSALIANRPADDTSRLIDGYLQFFADQTGGLNADPLFRDALNQFTADQVHISLGWPAPDATDANSAALALAGVTLPQCVRGGIQPDGTIQFTAAAARDEIDSKVGTALAWANTASYSARHS
jgi:hypothetical protein